MRAFVLQGVAAACVALVSLGLSVALAVLMGPAGFGSYAGIVTVASFLALIQDAGLRTLVAREQTAPTRGAGLPVDRLAALACGHLIMASAAILVSVTLFSAVSEAAALSWAVAAFGAAGLLQLGSALLRARGEFGHDAGWQIAVRAVSALTILAAAALFGARPAVVFAAWAIALLLLIPAHPMLRRLRPGFSLAQMPYRAAAGFLVVDLFTFCYNRLDILLLSLLLGDRAEVGRYAAGYRLFDGALLLAAPAAIVLFRKLRLAHANPSGFARLLRRSLAAAAAIGTVAALGGWLCGPLIAKALFGEAYARATGGVMQWLALALLFAFPNAVLTQAAIARGTRWLYPAAAAAAACGNLGLNLVLIPFFGIVGSAWATIATEAILGAVLLLGLRRVLLRDGAQADRSGFPVRSAR